MPAKGSGAGRTKSAEQLTIRVSLEEYTRIVGFAKTLGMPCAELIRVALNRYEPRLRLAVRDPQPYEASLKNKRPEVREAILAVRSPQSRRS